MAQSLQIALSLSVNGVSRRVEALPDTPLLTVLRDTLGLTGTKYGCGEGQCGACTVLVDGEAKRSCVTPLSSVDGAKIVTIEGLERDGKLHPVQQAFIDADAYQCGYCTPGMVLAAVALLRKNPNPTRAQIVEGMEGNICRCGTYSRIIAAVESAAKAMRETGR